MVGPHQYERQKGMDQTGLLEGKISFSSMTKSKGKDSIMLEEMRARGIEPIAEDLNKCRKFNYEENERL